MPDNRSTAAAGARTTRLGLVALGFVIGVIVTLLVLLMFSLRA